MDKVIFSTNVPQTVALKFALGKRVESKYNEYEMFYSITDGRALYASPALATKIAALEPAPGELLTICKREVKDGKGGKRIEWQVSNAASAEDPCVTPAAAEETPRATANAPLPARGPMTNLMAGALIAAIDALTIAQQYGTTKGMTLNFQEEDIRTVAATMFINYVREQERKQQASVYAAQPTKVDGGYRA